MSVVRVHADRDEQHLRLANLSIARYEQLGGDNIDAAIVERVLLPQLLRQNGLETLDVSFSEKQERIVPQLLSVAEALKLGLRGRAAEPPGGAAGAGGRPPAHAHPAPAVDDARPSSRGVLAPFVDADCTYPRDTEMNRVSSIFVPVRDALRRARLDAGQVDAVLLVGGSALLPQVQDGALGRSSPGPSSCGSRTTRGRCPRWRAGPHSTPSSSTASGGRCCGPSRRRAWGS